MTIHRRQLQIKDGVQEFDLPPCKILNFKKHGEGISFWYLFDETLNVATEKKRFILFGTGQKCGYRHQYEYLSTVIVGWFVWHVFKVDKI